MLPPSRCLPVHSLAACAELDALRIELRCILQHPAIAPTRRQDAELLISQCGEAVQLRRWLALTVTECGRWEEQMLASEAGGGGSSYFR